MEGDFRLMSGPEQVRAYNKMDEEAKQLGWPHSKPVTRFASTEVGARRCEMMFSTLRALQASAAAVEHQQQEPEPEPLVSVSSEVPPAITEPESEEEMARKRKTKTAKPKTTRTRKGNGRSMTGAEQTELFNERVKEAGKVGATKPGGQPWKAHTSAFISYTHGEEMIKRIEASIRAAKR